MKHARLALLVLDLALLTLAARPRNCFGDDQLPCTGKYKGYQRPTDAELKEILLLHSAWLKDKAVSALLGDSKLLNDPSRANLCGADLGLANLKLANLYGADLSGADLREADLTGASLGDADLEGAFTRPHEAESRVLGGRELEGRIPGWSIP
jgi:hypothetical protein